MIIFILVLRFIFLTLFVTDIFMKRKFQKNETTFGRSLSEKQKVINMLFYFIMAIGIFAPFEPIYLLVTIPAMIFFFYFTDKEIYVSTHELYLRGKKFEFKKMENFSYENKTIEFDYEKEHVKLSHPFITEGMIQRDIVYKMEKKALKEERRNKKLEHRK